MKTIKRNFGVGGAHLEYDLKGILEELQGLFNSSTGHDHSGTDKGKPIGYEGLADGNLFALEFYRQDVSAGQSYVPMEISPGVTEVVMPRAGSIVAMSLASSAARSSGWVSFSVFKNGALINGAWVTLEIPGEQYKYSVFGKGTKTFAAGDRLSVRMNSTSDWGPTTADVCVVVWLSI